MKQATVDGMSPREVEKPRCAACEKEMWLLRVEPRLASDLLTFECARCGATEQRETSPGESVTKAPQAAARAGTQRK